MLSEPLLYCLCWGWGRGSVAELKCTISVAGTLGYSKRTMFVFCGLCSAGVDVTSQLRYMYIVGTVVTAGVDVTSQLRFMYI